MVAIDKDGDGCNNLRIMGPYSPFFAILGFHNEAMGEYCIMLVQSAAASVGKEGNLGSKEKQAITNSAMLTSLGCHLLQNKFALDRQNAQHVRILLQKVQLLSTFCNNFSQPTTTSFVARQV